MSAAVELVAVSKRFPRVVALEGVSIALRAGEVHALVGENGAGKSTVVKVLAGLERPNAGEVRVEGRPVRFASPAAARTAGLGFVHQHFTLVPPFTVAENAALGREPRLAGIFYDREHARVDVIAAAARFGLAVAPDLEVETLSVGERQRVEAVKALAEGTRALVLDEPTAVLTPAEARDLLAALRRLAAGGTAVALVTHKLEEVFAVADRVSVLRLGRCVATDRVRDTSPERVARQMVGGAELVEVRWTPPAPGPVALEVRDLAVAGSRGGRAVEGLSLEVRAGEVLGIAGVEGNGQAELVLALAGILVPEAGAVRVRGADVTRASPAERLDRRLLAHIAADRHRHGVLLDATLEENLLLGNQRRAHFARWWGIDRRALRGFATERLRALDVRPPDPAARMGGLSGGNQQKVVVARELAREAAVLLAAQPTRGLDLAATARIHEAILKARDAGAAVLLVSTDLAEVRALADRIAVLYRGRIAGTLARKDATDDALAFLFAGAAS